MNSCKPIPKFIPSTAGNIFTITFGCSNPQAQLIFIPPFAEEANKSRHILSAFGRHLANLKIQTTIIDLYGCGDSEGDLDQASIEIWHQDITNTINHICKDSDNTTLILGGLRLGATIAASYPGLANHSHSLKQLLLWQPIVDGANYMKQFIRLKLAESITSGKNNNETTSTTQIIESILEGNTQEIAGYPLNKKLLNDINNLKLNKLDLGTKTNIVDINTSGNTSPSFSKLIEQQPNTQITTCQAPQFWAYQEIVQCEDLLKISAEILNNGQESANA